MNESQSIFSLLMEQFYIRVGSTISLDTLSIYLLAPVSFIGFVLNLFNIVTLFQINKSQSRRVSNIFKYMQFYSINSALICLSIGFAFITSPRYFSPAQFTSNAPRFYRCFVFNYAIPSLYFLANILDILMLLDRLTIFFIRLKIIKKLWPYFTCIVLTFVCFLIDFPTLFSYSIAHFAEFDPRTFIFCNQTVFYKSRVGQALNLVSLSIRDLLTLLMEIFFSIMILYGYKKYSSIQQVSSQSNQTHHHKVKRGKRLLLMTVLLLATSFVCHLLVTTTFVISIFFSEYRSIYFTVIFVASLFLSIKHSINFFIFVKFNTNFRERIVSSLKYLFELIF
jgi:hypothetical protein